MIDAQLCGHYLRIVDVGDKTQVHEGRNCLLQCVQSANEDIPLQHNIKDGLPEASLIIKQIDIYTYIIYTYVCLETKNEF
jgi:hypothetical protein